VIKLTSLETDIFKILLDTNTLQKCESTIRVAGGWVRDKMMGNESDDIDITIDNMSGLSFALKVAEQMELGDEPGVVKANPEKSKHIETAILNILGMEVQFTGFRKETYDGKSRIPIVEHGDLLEETFRRDFTINSLYYNINNKKVEDISEQGLRDLNLKTIRLMVPPKDIWKRMGIEDLSSANKKSFTDDPLRVLRAIRFGCRFNFGLSKELVSAALKPDVLKAFKDKVSRERMQIEFRKMMSGSDPERALGLIKDLGYLDILLPLPKGYLYWTMDQNTPYHEFNVWDHTMAAIENLQTIIKSIDLSDDDRFIMNLAILLHDVGKLNPKVHGKKKTKNGTRTTYYGAGGHEKHSMVSAETMLLNLPGIRNSEIKRVQILIEGSSRVNPNYIPNNQKCNLGNKALGKFVLFTKDDWQKAIFVNMADATSKRKNAIKDFDFTYHSDMMSKIRSLGPKKVMNLKPLLNGTEIISIVAKEPGPWVSTIISKMIEWQLKNPKVTRKDAEGFVKSFKKATQNAN
jgi:tRNA nucleotidyltransferase/poly(A) polymerase